MVCLATSLRNSSGTTVKDCCYWELYYVCVCACHIYNICKCVCIYIISILYLFIQMEKSFPLLRFRIRLCELLILVTILVGVLFWRVVWVPSTSRHGGCMCSSRLTPGGMDGLGFGGRKPKYWTYNWRQCECILTTIVVLLSLFLHIYSFIFIYSIHIHICAQSIIEC